MRRRPSIRVYLIGMNMLLLCLLIPALGFLVFWKTSQFRDEQLAASITLMRQDLANRSTSLVRSMGLSADQSIAGFDFSFLQNLVAEVVDNDPDILFCQAMDHQLTVVAHNDETEHGRRLSSAPESRRFATLLAGEFPKEKPDGPKPVRLIWPETDGTDALLEVIIPLYSGSQLWGALRCGFSLRPLTKAIAAEQLEWSRQMRHITISFLTVLAVFLLAGFLAAIFLTRSFARDARALHDGVHQIAAGDLNHRIELPGFGCQEFAGLAAAFNLMTERLRESREKLDDYFRSLEDKVAERTRDLKEAQAILLRQAHEAGMAEMAVGVLHNIGNAITPAKVVTSVLTRQIETSPLSTKLVDSLLPLQRYLQASRDIPEDEKKRLLRLVEILPAGISEEYGKIIEELKHIRATHEHIENIISLQMRYARLADSLEPVDIIAVARDAINMLAETLKKREILLETDLAPVPPVRVEGTKLLQVLVNLIKNGYEAMDGTTGLRILRMTSGLEAGAPPMVRLSITDMGCGFSDEEKEALFRFGYTTKHTGSGFGLHSSANYLKANNGSIEATSPGPGQGATFVVRLPAWSEALPAATDTDDNTAARDEPQQTPLPDTA
ncbi:MAG: ATP-binding protein [Thermodesulfobacteriota bacterium]